MLVADDFYGALGYDSDGTICFVVVHLQFRLAAFEDQLVIRDGLSAEAKDPARIGILFGGRYAGQQLVEEVVPFGIAAPFGIATGDHFGIDAGFHVGFTPEAQGLVGDLGIRGDFQQAFGGFFDCLDSRATVGGVGFGAASGDVVLVLCHSGSLWLVF